MNRLKSILKIIGRIFLPVVLIALLIFSIRVTQPDLKKLFSSGGKAGDLLSQFLHPDLTTRESTKMNVALTVPVPCGSVPNPVVPDSGPRLVVDPACGNVDDVVTLHGYDLPKNADLALKWILPTGGKLSVRQMKTDANGELNEPLELRPITAAADGVASQISIEVAIPGGQLVASQTLKDVVNAMMVTIFMALLATTFGTILAIPISFLAASNIMKKGKVGTVVYYVVRSIVSILRSYEALVLATIFAFIVGFGSPFAGVIALTITTAVSLGKMFSESVEGIDDGPIEAITATGANRLQVIKYAVVPQIIPDFLSFTIYHWDINVRMSTIIGFVGGGGIGYLISQWNNTLSYSKVGAALFAVILVVWALDFLSSEVRKQMI